MKANLPGFEGAGDGDDTGEDEDEDDALFQPLGLATRQINNINIHLILLPLNALAECRVTALGLMNIGKFACQVRDMKHY